MVQEDYRDARTGVEYNYIPPEARLQEYPWTGGVLTADSEYIHGMLERGYEPTGDIAVAGLSGVVMERTVPLPDDAQTACYPQYLLAGRDIPTALPSKVEDAWPFAEGSEPGCPAPADFEPVEGVHRVAYSGTPFGILLGSDQIDIDSNDRMFLTNSMRLVLWESVSAEEAPAELFGWQPPTTLSGQGAGVLPEGVGAARGSDCNDDQAYPYDGWWIWWSACIDTSQWPVGLIYGKGAQGGTISAGSWDYLHVYAKFRAKTETPYCEWQPWMENLREAYNATFVDVRTDAYEKPYYCSSTYAETSTWHYWQDGDNSTSRSGYKSW